MTQTFDVLVDYDDVLYPWSKRAHELCSQAGITNGHEIDRWHFWESYGCSEEAVWEVLRKHTLTAELYDAPLIPNTLSQLRRLRYAGHRVHIVTARGFGEMGELIELFTRNQIVQEGVPFDTLTFAKDKAAAALDLGASFALDDGTHNFEALREVGVVAVLQDAVHNQDYETPVGLRVSSVEQFVTGVLLASHLTSAPAPVELRAVA